MYGYIKGMVVEINTNHVIVDNYGIGYNIIVYNSFFYEINKEYKFLIHFIVKENLQLLYGFLNYENLNFFQKILDVRGIGPKSALILSSTENLKQTIKAIENNDIFFLIKFPGIGKKSAQQIILKLKDNLIFKEKNIVDKKEQEIINILLNLGFSKKEIQLILKKINKKQDLGLVIKEALSLLEKNIK